MIINEFDVQWDNDSQIIISMTPLLQLKHLITFNKKMIPSEFGKRARLKIR